MRVQQRRRAGLALASSVWLVLSMLLALHHVASVSHVVDRTSGKVHHTDRVIGTHVGDSDYHPTSPARHADDECSICAALDQAVRAPREDATVVVAPMLVIDGLAHRALPTRRAQLYRFAPKTSPPAAARAHA